MIFKKMIACKLLLLLLLLLSASLTAGEPHEFTKTVEQDIEGWAIDVDVQLLEPENKEIYESAKKALANHLQRVKYIVPAQRVAELQTIRIRLDLDYKPLNNLQYHSGESWLIKNGHDPALANHVHIPRAAALTERRQWAKHPYAILHELAHGYHDQVLGWDDPEIIAAYEQAKKSGSYEKVLDHNHQEVKHYGLTNHKEYFAESTEAYFGVSDFYPFVRAELKQHDPRMYSLMEKIWGEIP